MAKTIRVAAAGDIHAGATDGDRVREAFRRVEEQADLVLLAWAQDVGPGHGEVVQQVLAEVPVPVALVPAQPRLLDLSGLTDQSAASRPGG